MIMYIIARPQVFQAKLPLWKTNLKSDNYVNFSMIEEVLSQERIDNSKVFSSLRANFAKIKRKLQPF